MEVYGLSFHGLTTIPVVIACACEYNDFSTASPSEFDGNEIGQRRVIYRCGLSKPILLFVVVISPRIWIYTETNGDGRVDNFFNKGSGGRGGESKLLVTAVEVLFGSRVRVDALHGLRSPSGTVSTGGAMGRGGKDALVRREGEVSGGDDEVSRRKVIVWSLYGWRVGGGAGDVDGLGFGRRAWSAS